MSLSQAMLAVAEVAGRLAYTSEAVGVLKVKLEQTTPINSLREDFLRASLAIDSLDEPQVISTLVSLFDRVASLSTNDERALRQLHAQLLQPATDAGHYRSTGMGVYRQNRLVHMTAPANQISKMLRQRLHANSDVRHHPLLNAANTLFDLEFIQPFARANGVIARLWIKAILHQWHPFLLEIPFEQCVKNNQAQYYECLKQAIADNDNSRFIDFVLQLIGQAVEQLTEQLPNKEQGVSSEKNRSNTSELEGFIGSEKISTREKLLHLLEQQPDWSAARAAEVLGISSRAVEKHLSRLKRDGLLERQGSARAGRWIVTRPTSRQLSLPEY